MMEIEQVNNGTDGITSVWRRGRGNEGGGKKREEDGRKKDETRTC